MVYICQPQTPNPKSPPSFLSLSNHKYDPYDSESVSISQINSFVSCFRFHISVQFSCSVVSSSLRPMDSSMPGFPVHYQLPELIQTHVHQVGDRWTISYSVTPFSSCLQSFPALESLSNESVLCIRWPKYWSFSFSISPSNKYSGLISLRIDWFDLLAV